MLLSSSRVFISYNSKDRPEVLEIVERLQARGLKVWFDQEDIPPGGDIHGSIDTGLKGCTAVAAFVGGNGKGPWHEKEIGAAFEGAVARGKPLIPVALPGTTAETADVSLLVKGNRFVEFRSLDDVRALDELIWGVTGVKPSRRPAGPAAVPAPPAVPAAGDSLDEAIADLAADLRTSNLSIFVGSSSCGMDIPAGAENTRVAQTLLERLGHSGTAIVAPVDFIGRCYEIKHGLTQLEEVVSELGRGSAGPGFASGLPAALARLLVTLRALRSQRSRGSVQHLVVTTNLDTSLERGLLAAGLGFSRLVQRRDEPKLILSRHEASLAGTLITLRDGARETVGSIDSLDPLLDWMAEGSREVEAAALRNADLGDLVLYKVRGCERIPNSATLTTPQFFEFARNVIRGGFVPADVERLIGDSHALLLGYCVLDPDLRLLHHALLQRQFKEHADRPRYAAIPRGHVHAEGFRQLEELVGGRLRSASERELQVKILDVEPVRLVDRLNGDLSQGVGRGPN